MKTKNQFIMKKILSIGFFFLLFELTCYAQNPYSLENLQQSSQENLDIYLALAKKQKKTGAIIKTTGLLTAGAGAVIASVSDHDEWIISTGEAIGGVMVLLGIGTTMVGLPIQLTGSARIRRINSVMSQSSAGINLELSPCCFRNNVVQKNQYGATARIRF